MNEHGKSTAVGSAVPDYNGPIQFVEPRGIILATNGGSGEASQTEIVTIRVPSSRVRIKGSVFFVPQAGKALGDIDSAATIWVAACDEDTGGLAGGGGRIIPVTDLEGSSVFNVPVGAPGPTAFPKTDGLGGYAREFVTAAPWLQFTMVFSSISTPGAWVFRSSMQPDSAEFTFATWQMLRSLYQINLLTQPASL